jgi:hypothetical protein
MDKFIVLNCQLVRLPSNIPRRSVRFISNEKSLITAREMASAAEMEMEMVL